MGVPTGTRSCVNETTVARIREGSSPTSTSSWNTSPVKLAAAPGGGGPRRCTHNRHGFLRMVKIRSENRSGSDGDANEAVASIIARGRQHRRIGDFDQISPPEPV